MRPSPQITHYCYYSFRKVIVFCMWQKNSESTASALTSFSQRRIVRSQRDKTSPCDNSKVNIHSFFFFLLVFLFFSFFIFFPASTIGNENFKEGLPVGHGFGIFILQCNLYRNHILEMLCKKGRCTLGKGSSKEKLTVIL